MNLYSRGRARRSLFDTAYLRVTSQIATMVGYVVLVRGISEQDFGVFNLLYAVIPVISSLASFGVDNVLQRYEPEYLGSQQAPVAAWLVAFTSRLRFLANLCILGLIFASWHLITPVFQLEPYRVEFAMFAVVILIFFQMRVLETSLSSHMLHKFAIGSYVVLAFAKLVGYALFALTDNLTLQNAILTDVFAQGVAYAGMYAAHRRYCGLSTGSFAAPPSPEEKRRLLRYGLFYNFNDVGTLALGSRIDNFFIASLMDTVAVGTYSFYTRLSGMVSRALPTSTFQNVIRPVFFAIPQSEAAAKIPAYVTLLINANLLFTVPITAYAAVYHLEIVDLVFGGKFREESVLLPIVLSFVTMRVISAPVALAAQYEERALLVLLSKVFGIVNLLAMVALIPLIGIYGAALSTGFSEVSKNLFIWWSVRHTARWTNFLGAMAATLTCWGAFFVLGSVLRAQLAVSPFIHMLFGAALCLLAAAVYPRTALFCASDRAILGSVLKGRERKWLALAGLTRPAT